MATPYTLENTLRIHDTAFYNWLGDLRVDYGAISGVERNDTPILRVMASPARAVAEVADLLVRTNWISGADAEEMRNNADADFATVPLPLATWMRLDPQPDPELAGVPKVFRQALNCDTGLVEAQPWPIHYRTTYTVNFWCKYRYTEAHIREWIYSQFGSLGSAQNETMIEVIHDDPFGTMLHAMRFEGTTDLSDLEGVEQRYIRFEATFSLRTWVMKAAPTDGPQATGVYPLVQRVSLEVCEYGDGWGDTNNDGEFLETVPVDDSATGNLFKVPFMAGSIPSRWPKMGNAEVFWASRSPGGSPATKVHNTLGMRVDDGDSVIVGHVQTDLDVDGYALVSHSFNYMATEDVELHLRQHVFAEATYDEADRIALPATDVWKAVHRFSVFRKDTIRSDVFGLPAGLSEVYLNDVDIRILGLGTKLTVSQQDAGSEWLYQWGGLENVPHLCILVLTATSGGSGNFTVEDDATAPTYTVVRSVDETVNVGAVILAQPKGATLAARIDKTISIEAVYLHQYSGAYNGNEV